MKRLKITVNGKVYDVQVEELSGTAPVSIAPPAAPAVPATAVPAAAPATTPAAAPQPAEPAGSSQGDPVMAPMPGTILDIKVSKGASVKSGDVLFVLEAMKMENDIVSPRDGVVAGIHVNKGDSVESNQTVITLG